MGRTSNKAAEPAELIEVTDKAHAKLEALQDGTTVHEREKDEVFAAGVDIGRIEALDFLAVTANTAILAIYENVKKSKAWQHLKNPQTGGIRHFESLEEFCQVKLGKSYRRMRELSAWKSALGHDAYEQAERLGLRDVDYNAIKTLPAPDQELVRRAVEDAQSKDEVVDLIQELAARTAQHKAKAEESEAELTAQKRLVETKTNRIKELVADLEEKRQRVFAATPDEALRDLKTRATATAVDAEAVIEGGLRQALIALNNHGNERGQHQVFMAGLVGQVQASLNALRQEFGLLDISDAERQALAAEMAEWNKE